MKLTHKTATAVRLFTAWAALGCVSALAQDPVTQPATTAASAATAGSEFVYEAIGVQGKVRVAGLDADPNLDDGWNQVKVGDVLKAGQQVKVSLRSKLKLVARPEDPPTVLLFDTMSVVQIAELSHAQGVATTRINLKYGEVKGGVAEGQTRSDLTIQSPGAMLSKKGTDIFGFEARPDGRFNMYLTDQGRGMLQAILNQSSAFGGGRMQSRFLTPGQWITHQMARAIDTVQFDSKVQVTDPYGLTGTDQLFTMLNDRGGLGFLLPPGNNAALLGNPGNQGANGLFGNLNNQANPFNAGNLMLPPGVRNVPGGDFGIGQGPIPSVFGPARAIKPMRSILQRR